MKATLRFTISVDIELDPKWYGDLSTVDQMVAVERANYENDPIGYLGMLFDGPSADQIQATFEPVG